MHQPVENAVGQGGITNLLVPLGDRQLTGEDHRAHLVAVLADFQEVAPLGVGQGRHGPVVHQQHVEAGQSGK